MNAKSLLVVGGCQDPKTVHRPQIELAGVNALAATDYTKKPNVFRLKLSNGAEYLFHAKDEVLATMYCHLYSDVSSFASLFFVSSGFSHYINWKS